jgi:uncharacterized protein YdeI (BOF family)
MRRYIHAAILAFVASLAVGAGAATWNKLGDSPFTTTPGWNIDYNRIRLNCIAVDGAGNIYATAVNGNNLPGTPGGYTIFKTDGSRIDVDLSTYNGGRYKGGITKLVRAGDGAVYALQNWLEINWLYNDGVPDRIIRLDPNGTIALIYEMYKAGQSYPFTDDTNRIGGMAVGGDGNIYWTANGADSYWKVHFLWRYDVASGSIEEAPINSINNGWSETHRLLDLEYVGNNRFAVIKSGGAEWRADPISWTDNRVVAPNGVSNPGWGRDWCTHTAYDPVKNKLWIGARGQANRLILSRWKGQAGGTGLFTDAAGNGIVSSDVWHSPSDTDFGTIWWISALACHPVTGDAWMGYTIASPLNTIGGWRGKVFRYDQYLGMFDEGTPQAGADVCAIAFNGSDAYVTVLDTTSGVYSYYTTAADTFGPTVTITSPTSNPTYSTGVGTINIAGTATDNVGVTSVTWSNDRGGSGTASGTTSWSVNGIVLQPGVNVLTVTAYDAAGNSGTDTLTVTYNNNPPTVTINQAAAQLDPTHGATINFTVVFSEAVTGFATGDVTLGGTAGATSAVVSGSGANYTVAVSGMTATGTVIATIPAGVATSVATGLGNAASTSTDNTVTYVAGGVSVADAKQLPNNAYVGLVIKIVTAVFSDHFYVQDSTGMGIKVKPASMPGTIAIGKKVDIAGLLKTDANDERYIDGIASVQTGSGTSKPYGMCNRSLGGGNWLYNAGTGAGQKGVTGGSGANNIGLLATTTGRVLSAGPGYFIIDDGSGVQVKCVVPAGVTSPGVGTYVSVTGISSMEKTSGVNNRVLKVRVQADIR